MINFRSLKTRKVRWTHLLALAPCLFAMSACDKALVYGERSGLNIAIRADGSEGNPLEVNTGFQRRVVGFVPGRGTSDSGQAEGEAVNMMSSFGIDREGEDGPFEQKVQVRGFFVAGQAAVQDKNPEATVKAIVQPAKFRISDDPDTRDTVTALLNFVSKSDANANDYLARAKALGVTPINNPNTRSAAAGTILAQQDGPINKTIRQQLKL